MLLFTTRVAGYSMQPTLFDGDIVLRIWPKRLLSRGQIVVWQGNNEEMKNTGPFSLQNGAIIPHQRFVMGLVRCPHGESNPGFGLERATS